MEYLLNSDVKQRLVQLLRRSADTKRLIQKFSLGRGDADDLIALSRTIRITFDIAATLAEEQDRKEALRQRESTTSKEEAVAASISAILSRLNLNGPGALADRIAAAIDEEGVTQMHHVEELQAAAAVAMAQTVENGETEESVADNAQEKKAPLKGTFKPEIAKGQEVDVNDVWVMKKRCRRETLLLHLESAKRCKQCKRCSTTTA